MNTENTSYWLSIGILYIEERGKIDFLLRQKNGHEVALLYFLLCMNLHNSCGDYIKVDGKIMIRFDVDEIAHNCEYFERDIVVRALELFTKIGLVYIKTKDGFVRTDSMEYTSDVYAENKGSDIEKARKSTAETARSNNVIEKIVNELYLHFKV